MLSIITTIFSMLLLNTVCITTTALGMENNDITLYSQAKQFNKNFLIEHAPELNKYFIHNQKVIWNEDKTAYAFIDQTDRYNLKLTFTFLNDDRKSINETYLKYEKNRNDQHKQPIYLFPNDDALPFFNENHEACFHADAHIYVPKVDTFRQIILYSLNKNGQSKELRCRTDLFPYISDKYYSIANVERTISVSLMQIIQFPSLLTAFLQSSKKKEEKTNFYLTNEKDKKKYKKDDTAMVYSITGVTIPEDYALCKNCDHFPNNYNCGIVHYFENLPKDYQRAITQRKIDQQSNSITCYQDPVSKENSHSINNLLENNASWLQKLIKEEEINGYCSQLHQAEITLHNALQSNIFSRYSQSIKKYALTISDRAIARNVMIQLIQTNNEKEFSLCACNNPTALNAHSPLLNKGTPTHLIAYKGLNNFLEIAIKNNAHLNRCDKYDRSPLFYAIINQHLQTAQNLITHKASTQLKDYINNTILHYAVCQTKTNNDVYTQKEIIKLCLNADKLLINQQNNTGNTPLHIALLGDIDYELLNILFTNDFINFDLKNRNELIVLSILDTKAECQEKANIKKLIDNIMKHKQSCNCNKKSIL